MRIFFNVFAAKKPSHWLSGDQKSVRAPSVPGRSWSCSGEYRDRTQTLFVPSAPVATYAICRPSGDNASGTSEPEKNVPSAGDSANRIGAAPVVETGPRTSLLRVQVQYAAPAMHATTIAAHAERSSQREMRGSDVGTCVPEEELSDRK